MLPAPQKAWLVNMPAPFGPVFVHDWLLHEFELSQSWQRAVPGALLSPVHLPFVPQLLGVVATHIPEGSV